MQNFTHQQLIETKKPDLRYPVIEEYENRFSPRFYADSFEEKDLNSIFEAARWAPSARNRQPWFYYWTGKGSEAFEKIVLCLPIFNQWAKDAPVLIVACYIKEDKNGTNPYALYDLGASVMALVTQAQSMGYHVRQIGAFDKEKAKKVLNIENSQEPYIILPLGKLGDYSKAPESIIIADSQKRERKTDLARQI